jgi:DNA-binding PadR family transcriptional regulator
VRYAGELVPLKVPAFAVLVVLGDEALHGYEIMKRVKTRSGGKMVLGPSSLYGILRRLLDNGLIEESDERPVPELDDERRRYYRITEFGREVLHAQLDFVQTFFIEPVRGTSLLR